MIYCYYSLLTPSGAGKLSRDFCRAFNRALKIDKLKSSLFPGPEAARDTNDWCIKFCSENYEA